ncbi:uncharacterized mitochondrial protein AtMg00810-like [Gastrolobium bilobum]|uniref:uncharacterized mitochondrial protein AtMg00810-like n=1 Tax=Gastrolobium bilobum TaxID=150636 RepID=UPI002AB13C80|nr:uncharacterized mitochondrial protein AtMg00810-like [Gastrolobium bilobum]
MTIPPGLHRSKNNQACRLNKSLYGLKQASRQWYSKLSEALLTLGYIQGNANHSMFTRKVGSSFTVLLVYVDDVVLSGNSPSEITRVKAFLHEKFKIKDLGPLRYFLGLEVSRTSRGIHLNQHKYALEILSDMGMLATKPSSTPMEPSSRLSRTTGSPLIDEFSYHRLVGRLLYLTTTRPDFCFAVQQLSQFVSCPRDAHHQAALRILKYLKGAPASGLFFPSSPDIQVRAFADSDWACCPDTRRSTAGFCIFFGSSLVAWKTKKQSTVSRSSSKAEYRALAILTCEIQWLQHLFHDLHIQWLKPASVFCDNKSAIYLAHNLAFHKRSIHIEIDFHITREKLQSGLLRLLPVTSSDQLADMFTKSLPPAVFHTALFKLGLVNIHGPTCEGVMRTSQNPSPDNKGPRPSADTNSPTNSVSTSDDSCIMPTNHNRTNVVC